MAYRFKTRSTTPGQNRLTNAAVALLFAEQKAVDVAEVDAVKASILTSVTNLLGSVVGTFDEAARNTDPGVANVLSSAGNYKIANVTKTPTYHAPDAAEVISTAVFGPSSGTAGTFDEAARNTDPGVAHVEDGVTYKIANVAKEGTLVGGSDPEPDPIAFLRKVKE